MWKLPSSLRVIIVVDVEIDALICRLRKLVLAMRPQIQMPAGSAPVVAPLAIGEGVDLPLGATGAVKLQT